MRKRSRKDQDEDFNEAAFRVVQEATGEKPDTAPAMPTQRKRRKNHHAVALGRKGGRKGGKARAASMTAEECKASAVKAIRARSSNPR